MLLKVDFILTVEVANAVCGLHWRLGGIYLTSIPLHLI